MNENLIISILMEDRMFVDELHMNLTISVYNLALKEVVSWWLGEMIVNEPGQICRIDRDSTCLCRYFRRLFTALYEW